MFAKSLAICSAAPLLEVLCIHISEHSLACMTLLSKVLPAWTAQYMAGGDLGSALRLDLAENGDGAKRRLGWYGRGRLVLLCVARGLVYLHDQRVRPWCIIY